jgi:CDP-diacylglycerol---glycerol-3-phosphate 3-phosphatidyltransferase
VPRTHPLYKQMIRIWRQTGRWLPSGWLDAIRQLALFAGAYYVYRLVRGFVDGQAGLAFENARALVDIERSLGLFFEPGLQAWAKGEVWLLTFANWMYVNSHFVVTTTFLIWLYLARNHAYYYVRNMFLVAMGLALVGYMAFPTAPPRFLPEWGFTDTVANFVGETAETSADVLYNPFAAVPSMHVAFALMIAGPQPGAQGALGGLSARRDVRRDGHRQPLLARRGVGSACGSGLGIRGELRLRARAARGLVLAQRRRQGAGVSDRIRERPSRRGNGGGPLTATEIRTLARDRLIESRLTPNAISVTGLVGNIVAAVLIVENHFVLAGIAFILGSVCDMLDGRYSRMSGKGTPFGAFLDSTLDRVSEGIVLAAVAAYFAQQQDDLATGATVLAVVGSFSVSYTRARAEALGVKGDVGIASRPVRVVILSIGLVFAAGELLPDFDLLEPAIYAMAVLTIFTTFQRVLHVRRQLAGGAGAV